MDIFMDKLAQRHNAQEIIRANTTAEAEELDKLRSRVAEYNECLDRLKGLIEENAAGLEGAARKNAEEINRLVEESLTKIGEIQRDSAGLEKLRGQLGDMNVAISDKFEQLSRQLEGTAQQMKETAAENTDDKLADKFAATDENVHKECVKVYRNVQAVVLEESGKRGVAQKDISAQIKAVQGKLGAVLGISIAALIVSLVGMVFQFLSQWGVSLL